VRPPADVVLAGWSFPRDLTMRKETKVGVSLVALLLGVFCFVLYKRVQGRSREAAEALAQQEVVAAMETTQVTAKPVLDSPPRQVPEVTGSRLMEQAWRQPVRPTPAPESQFAGNGARLAQAQPPAPVEAVDPFAGRVSRSMEPVAEPVAAEAGGDRGFVASEAVAQEMAAAQDVAAADALDRGEEPLANDRVTVAVRTSRAQDVEAGALASEAEPVETYRLAAEQPTPPERPQAMEPQPVATYSAAEPAETHPAYRETYRAQAPVAQVEPVTAARRYEEPRYEEPRQQLPQREHGLRDESPAAGYAARVYQEPAARDPYAEPVAQEPYSRGGYPGQDLDQRYAMDGPASRAAEPYRGAEEDFEREPARGSFAQARFVAQGRPAVAEEAADPVPYGGDRWHPDRNAAPAAQPQSQTPASQSYYDSRGAAGVVASQPPAAAPRGQYTVMPNDSFWTISRKLYGDGGFFKALAEHNRRKFPDTRSLKVGDVISAPPAEELRKAYPDLCPKLRQPAPATARTVSGQQRLNAGRIYVVEEGDTLFDIARHELGSPARWVEIFELNADRLSNDFDYIKPGTELILPADPVRGDVRRENVTRRPGNPASR